MKILTNDSVYVQKIDIAYLLSTDIVMPHSIMINTFGENGGCVTTSNRFDFVKFDKDYEIAFFNNFNWILNYDDVKDLNEEALLKLSYLINDKKRKIINLFNSMNSNDQKNNLFLLKKFEALNFKLLSLKDYISYKQGRINMTFPTINSKLKIKK